MKTVEGVSSAALSLHNLSVAALLSHLGLFLIRAQVRQMSRQQMEASEH